LGNHLERKLDGLRAKIIED